MRKWKPVGFGMMCLAALLSTAMAFSALAKEEDEEDEIRSVSITVDASVESGSGGSIQVTSSSDRYHVDFYDYEDGKSTWEPGDIPRIKIRLEAEEDCYFSRSIGTTKVRVKGNGAQCTGVKRLGRGDQLEVTVKLKPIEGDFGVIQDAYWQSEPLGKAKWDEAENATAYELKLYRGSTLLKRVDKTTTTTYDFFPYMTKQGDYEYMVRPIPRNANEDDYMDMGEWTTSDSLYIKNQEVASESDNQRNHQDQAPVIDGKGWEKDISGWWYRREDGSWPVSGWEMLDGKWYLFDMKGYIETGWKEWGDQEYYMTSNGDMVTGWLQYDKNWYFMDESGKKMYGWITWNDKRYYLKGNGTMVTGWQKVGTSWYYFNPEDGHSVADQMVGGYYLDETGVWIP